MAFVVINIPLPTACYFLLAQKGATNQRLLSQLVGEQKGHPECFRDPILPPTYPAHPSLGKEASALFCTG